MILLCRLIPCALLLFAFLHEASLAAERPNIVLIFTDDQGVNDVGCYGSEIPTPHIDQLAKEGLRFDQWYSASSICTPSRFGLLTGKNPSRSQDELLGALMFLSEEDHSRGIHSGETTIAQVLQQNGYSTALIGKWHLGHGERDFLPINHGFEKFIGHTGGCIDYFTMTYGIQPDWYHQDQHVMENGYATELITDEAIRFLEAEAHQQQKEHKPFFLYLAYNAPHFGKGWSPADQAPVNIMQAQANDLQRVSQIKDKIRREFAAMVVSLDDGIGRLMSELNRLQLAEDTLVIFLTDHGGDPKYGGSNLPLRGNKATLYEGGIRVPCIMRWPGVIKPDTRTDAIASSLDLFPTLCTLAGIDDSSYQLDGLDISPTLHGKSTATQDRELYWELGRHDELKRNQWLALRQGDWKLITSPSGGTQLFNLANDPQETTDLSEKHSDILNSLIHRRDELKAAYRER
ncbi:sulfatase-like hydrolase/transferase [Calycomorphotria hydatis]|uniref:Arylsulfatase n=1 Tax=Calycomorphotria hydatis TaxID=2528027 RepID=A0A517TF80_9PLAN|nr:sulfatase-like hydrolase/transferase [Calycomorphotria hydatis]QDT67033.1 Arylsulfatase [Calycomorphotria hydatis]